LENDPRFQVPTLTNEEKESAFREHVKKLMEDQLKNYRLLLRELSETGQINLTSTDFDSLKKFMEGDARYEKLHKEDRKFLFDAFVQELKKEAFQVFQGFLKESKLEGVITSKSSSSGPKFEALKGILKNDKRFSTLDPFPEERDRIIVSFIESLQTNR